MALCEYFHLNEDDKSSFRGINCHFMSKFLFKYHNLIYSVIYPDESLYPYADVKKVS